MANLYLSCVNSVCFALVFMTVLTSGLKCIKCEDQPGDGWCNGKKTTCTEAPEANKTVHCFTSLKDTLLTKGCELLETDKTGKWEADDNVTYDKKQYCSTDNCNEKTTWDVSDDEILRRSVGLDVAEFTGYMMYYQLIYTVLYCAVVGYISFTYWTKCRGVTKRVGNTSKNFNETPM